MKFDEVQRIVGRVPFITPQHARELHGMIVRERMERILELGIAHGTATCTMAAALEELGRGKVTAVDLQDVTFAPSAEEQLARCGLSAYAEVVRMKTGYTWFLHDEIRRQTVNGTCQPAYDLCIIDGPKNWTIDGCAFFLADKLLRPGGWIIFDDYAWTYARADGARAATDGITHRELSLEERTTPQVREVFELLVVPHPDYANFVVYDQQDWAMAQKVSGGEKTYTMRYRGDFGQGWRRVANLAQQAAGHTMAWLGVRQAQSRREN
jgi:predicted O-methyltransferase YrrM